MSNAACPLCILRVRQLPASTSRSLCVKPSIRHWFAFPTVPPVCSLPPSPSQSDMELRAVSSACDASKVHSLPPSLPHSRSPLPWAILYARPCSLYSCHAWNNEDDSLAFAQTTEITPSSTGLESPSSARLIKDSDEHGINSVCRVA